MTIWIGKAACDSLPMIQFLRELVVKIANNVHLLLTLATYESLSPLGLHMKKLLRVSNGEHVTMVARAHAILVERGRPCASIQ